MRLTSWLAAALLGGACTTLGCQQESKVNTCALDRSVIASWLHAEHLGQRPADPAQARRWEAERDESLRVVLEEPPFIEWCSRQTTAIDTTCWTLAGDVRRECLVARQELMRLPVPGPLCELDSRYLVSVWLVADTGIKPDSSDEHAYQRYQTAVLATYNRLAPVPVELVCKQTGGYPIGCYVDGTSPPCRLFASEIAYWMAHD